jgi:hypothetical protein
MILSPNSQPDGHKAGEPSTETVKWVTFHPDTFGPEAKAMMDELRASYTKLEALQNQLLAKVKKDGDEQSYKTLAEKFQSDRDELLGDYDPKDADKWAEIIWKSLKDEAGFDLRGVIRRRALVPFVLFPRHVAAHHGQTKIVSIYENLRRPTRHSYSAHPLLHWP